MPFAATVPGVGLPRRIGNCAVPCAVPCTSVIRLLKPAVKQTRPPTDVPSCKLECEGLAALLSWPAGTITQADGLDLLAEFMGVKDEVFALTQQVRAGLCLPSCGSLALPLLAALRRHRGHRQVLSVWLVRA